MMPMPTTTKTTTKAKANRHHEEEKPRALLANQLLLLQLNEFMTAFLFTQRLIFGGIERLLAMAATVLNRRLSLNPHLELRLLLDGRLPQGADNFPTHPREARIGLRRRAREPPPILETAGVAQQVRLLALLPALLFLPVASLHKH